MATSATFAELLGSEHVERRPDDTLDGVVVEETLRPGDGSEVAASLAIAAEHGFPVVACGGGTRLASANPLEAESAVRLELGRLDALELDPDEGIAFVGAGIPLDRLDVEARGVGKRVWFGESEPGATLGGRFSGDAVCDGPPDRRLAYEVLGLTAALADGTLARAGGRVVKNVTGFDLVRLYAGSFGSLVVITDLVVRLRPLPEATEVRRVESRDTSGAIALSQELRRKPSPPERLRIDVEGDAAVVSWVLEGAETDVRRRVAATPGEAADGAPTRTAKPAGSGARACAVRLCARPSDLDGLAHAIVNTAGASALDTLLPLVGVAFAEVDEEGAEKLAALAATQGWLFRLERAPLPLRRRLDAFGAPPATLPLMRQLKQRFDVHRILSPGRFVGRI